MTVPPPPSPACIHCGTAMESAADRFCCHGCETAYAIIHGAGLDKYYAERELPAPRPGGPVVGWSAIPTIKCPDGAEEVRLQVDGLRCASCVWVLEHVLERTPGVEHAMVSYATGRASIRWDPRRIDLSSLATRIAALGYRPRALGVETAPDRALLYRLGVAAFAAVWLMATLRGPVRRAVVQGAGAVGHAVPLALARARDARWRSGRRSRSTGAPSRA